MEVKLFEVRDHMTCMPVLCVKMTVTGPSHSTSEEKFREGKLLKRAGWSDSSNHIILWALTDNPDEFVLNWNDRTRRIAHQWITDNWDKLRSGEIIDVRYLLKETNSPCETDL